MNRMKRLINILRLQYLRYTFYKRDIKILPKEKLGMLTTHEIRKIQENWPVGRLRNLDLIYPKIFRYVYGYLPTYFMTDYQLSQLYEHTNSIRKTEGLENKALADVWFPSIPFPKVIIRQINNVFYAADMSIVTEEEAISLLYNCEMEHVVIKPSIDSNCGKGVYKLDLSNTSMQEVLNRVRDYNGNFLVQEVIESNKEISKLCPSSINSCRITSIFINGKYDYSACIKVGKKDSFLDNWRGSYFVGVDKCGVLSEFGLDNRINKAFCSDTGIPFKGFKIPCFQKMTQFVEETHKRLFPHIGVVGWDILIDSNYEVKVIEVNLSSPGVVGEQLASGTFFEPFWDDICEIINEGKQKCSLA